MANTQSSPYANDEYTVGWICALPHEFAAAKGMLDEEHGEPQILQAGADDNSYFLGSVGKFKVVIACLPLHQIGPISAAPTAKEMLFTFPKIRVGLLVGIGAGIPDEDDEPDIRLGDIVISSSPKTGGVVVYDFGKQLADGSFESLSVLNRPPRSLASGLSKLQAQNDMHGSKVSYYIEQMLDKYPHMRKNGYAYPGQSRDRLFRPEYPHITGKTCKKCEESGQVVRETRADDAPIIHYGTIASGSMVVKDPVKRDNIRDKHGAICLEMEAAGLMNIFPCIVIRGISDYADSHKNDGWQKYAAAAAAACAKEFLEYVPAKSIDVEPAAKDLLEQVRAEIVKVGNYTITEQTRQVLDWLTPLNFDDYQNDILSRRQEGTGLWFLNSDEFTQWISQPNQTLFCPGIPGAGKTFISSIVVEHLKFKSQENPRVQICSIFCSFQPNHQRSVLDLLLSLLRQLAVKGSTLLKNIEDMHACHKKNKTRSTLTEVQTEIVKTAGSYETVFIVIDALDEYCSPTSEELHTFLSTVFDLQKNAPINILATSRYNSSIMSRFETCLQKEIRAQEDDIQIYLNSRIPLLLENKSSLFPDCEDDVRREVMKSADGMFLLVKLHMDNLMGHITPGDLEEALINLPHGDTRLQVAYNETIKRIKSQHQSRYQMALKILSWLTYCKRDLFPKELQHALGTRPGDKDLNRRFLPELDIIDSLCAGLVVYDQRSGIIHLAHYTTKEYLLHHPELHDAETEITKTSITYLSFDCFANGRSSNAEEYSHRLREYALYQYCARNWALHASQALTNSIEHSKSLIDLILEFLNKDWNIQAAGQAMVRVYTDFEDIPRRLTKVHLVAYTGLASIISRYISSGEDLEAQDSDGMVPLAYAVKNGHLEVTELLIQSNRVYIDVQDKWGCTPLLLAASGGHIEVVEALLRCGARPDIGNQRGLTPLLIAASGGHIEVVEALLRCGARPDIEDQYGWTPLCEAASNRRVDIIQILLDNGAIIDHRSDDRDFIEGTPLMLSRKHHDKEAMWLLLERGADPDFSNKTGDTLLHAAAKTGDQGLVDYLLKRGVSVSPRDDTGRDPLWYAVKSRHATIVKSLLDARCDVDSQAGEGETSLMVAIKYNYRDITAQLIEYGANLSLQDHRFETALFYAVRQGNAKIVEALLEHEASPNVQNEVGETPLFVSVKTGDEEISKLLLSKGADPFIKNKYQQTVIFFEKCYDNTSILSFLIDAGLDVNAEDDMGNTAIFNSAGSGNIRVTQMLLERGASVYHRNALGETALFYAAWKGRLEASKLLVQSGAELNARNIVMQTPLAQAAWGFSLDLDPLLFPGLNAAEQVQVVKMLIENGANPNPSNLAAHVKHPEAWEFLRSAYIYFEFGKCILEPGSPLHVRFCEAAHQIWSSRIQGYSEDQVLDFLYRLLYAFNSSSWRICCPTHGDMETVVDLLISRGADANIVDEDGQTALSLLVTHHLNSKYLVRLLLRAGCNPNSKDKYGRTPLMGATVQGLEDFVAALLKAPNLDRDATDNFGRTAVIDAIERSQPRILGLLSQFKPEAKTQIVHPSILKDGLTCDICQATVPRDHVYHCSICNEDDFDICEECKKWGATCLDSTHVLSEG